MQEKVSIIIPIYQVENYIDKCVKSILNQTYNNLEIILVNDGSPDNCGKICDSYASIDGRIRVFHKENGGLSDARNFGIDRATGDYILFVDSDDWIEEDTVEYLLNIAVRDASEITMVTYATVLEDSKDFVDNNHQYTERRLEPADALNDALYGHGSTLHSWGKLYKKKLFDSGIRFPKDRLYEDAGTTYKLVAKSSCVSISSARKYYYRQRPGSILNSGFSVRMMDSLYFADEMLKFASNSQPESKKSAQSYAFAAAMHLLIAIVLSGGTRIYSQQINLCYKEIRKFRFTVLFDPKTIRIRRIYALLSYLGLSVIILTYKTRKKIKDNKVIYYE